MPNSQKEYLEDGYIKLSRKIFNSKTFSSLNAIQKLITIYLIMMANYKDVEWWDNYKKEFITIKRGSFVTSVNKIRKSLKSRSVTTMKVRSLLTTLQSMQFLTIKTTSHYTLITIEKYNLYQGGDSYINKPSNKALTKPQQSLNKALTITNKDNKDKKDKKGKNVIEEKGIFFKTWNDFKIMRKKIKKPMTEKAEELLLNKLNKLDNDEDTQIAILNQSIMNCWQSVYPLKVDNSIKSIKQMAEEDPFDWGKAIGEGENDEKRND